MRYYFDLVDPLGFKEDREGTELANRDAARLEAQRILTELAAGEPLLPADALNLSVKVRNESDDPVYELTLSLDSKPMPAALAG